MFSPLRGGKIPCYSVAITYEEKKVMAEFLSALLGQLNSSVFVLLGILTLLFFALDCGLESGTKNTTTTKLVSIK